jgi:hypothetical protein
MAKPPQSEAVMPLALKEQLDTYVRRHAPETRSSVLRDVLDDIIERERYDGPDDPESVMVDPVRVRYYVEPEIRRQALLAARRAGRSLQYAIRRRVEELVSQSSASSD